MEKPLILIPVAAFDVQNPPRYGVNKTYADRISAEGGIPLFITRPSKDELEQILSFADGILLAGGHDVDPTEYGEIKNEHTCNIDKSRDGVELMLARIAKQDRIPLLGICRGMQIMNVAFGGNLFQDVEAEMAGAMHHDNHYDANGKELARNMHAHEVKIIPDTLLSDITKTQTLTVNSLHHQGIRMLAPGLVSCATAKDRLVEAIAAESHPFMIGVQWHPEELQDDASNKLFSAFIEACKKRI